MPDPRHININKQTLEWALPDPAPRPSRALPDLVPTPLWGPSRPHASPPTTLKPLQSPSRPLQPLQAFQTPLQVLRSLFQTTLQPSKPIQTPHRSLRAYHQSPRALPHPAPAPPSPFSTLRSSPANPKSFLTHEVGSAIHPRRGPTIDSRARRHPANIRPTSAQLGPTSTNVGPDPTNFGANSTHTHTHWPGPGRLRPNLADTGRSRPGRCRVGPGPMQDRSAADPGPPGSIRGRSGAIWGRFGVGLGYVACRVALR